MSLIYLTQSFSLHEGSELCNTIEKTLGRVFGVAIGIILTLTTIGKGDRQSFESAIISRIMSADSLPRYRLLSKSIRPSHKTSSNALYRQRNSSREYCTIEIYQ